MDTSYLDHLFGSRQIICLGTSYPAHSFGIGWIIYPDTSHLEAHSFDARWKEVSPWTRLLSLSYTLSEVEIPETKPVYVIFQATVPAKVPHTSPSQWQAHCFDSRLLNLALRSAHILYVHTSTS